MSQRDLDEYGVYSLRIGERKKTSNKSIFKDKAELIGDENGKMVSITNRDQVTFFKNPPLIDNIPINTLGESIFEDSTSIESVTLTDGITKIEKCAFKNASSLKSIVLPEGLIEIDDEAFSLCESLEEVVFPKSLKRLGTRCFLGAKNLKKAIFQESKSFLNGDIILDMGRMAFSECLSIEEVVLPVIEEIPDGAFMESSLRSIHLPRSVKKIGSYAFSRCWNLREIYFEGSFDEMRKIEFGLNWNRDLDESLVLYAKGDDGSYFDIMEKGEGRSYPYDYKTLFPPDVPLYIEKAMKDLGIINPSFTMDELQRKYHEKAKAFHPDRILALNLDASYIEFASVKFKELTEDYELLKEYLYRNGRN